MYPNCRRKGFRIKDIGAYVLHMMYQSPVIGHFYSCVLSYLAMNASEAGGDLV